MKQRTHGLILAALVISFSVLGYQSLVSADAGYVVSGSLAFGNTSTPGAHVTFELTNKSTGMIYQTTTDIDGNYSLSNIPDGMYSAMFTDYKKGNGSSVPTTFGAWPLSGSIVVADADVTQNFNFDTNTVAVTVKDAHGNLAQGAQVTLSNTNNLAPFSDVSGDYTFKSYAGNIVSTVTTNSSGVATAAVIPGMTYTVCATLNGGGQYCTSDMTVTSDTSDELDFPVTHTVSGTVSFGSSLDPAANANITLTNTTTGAVEQVVTDSSGEYSISNVPDGDYTAYLIYYQKGNGNPIPTSFSAYPLSGYVSLSGSDLTRNFNFNTNTVAVTVRDANGNLAPGATVTLSNTGPYGTFTDSTGALTFKTYGGNTASTVTTNSSGVATAAVIPGMTYTVCATLNGGGQQCDQNITINGNALDELDFLPVVPNNLIAVSPTKTPVLSWSAVSGATSYNIYRDGSKIGTATSMGYTDSAASDGTHSYYVTAVNSGGESGPSNTINVLVDKTRPTASFTSPSSFAGPFPAGPTVSITISDNGSGLQVMAIHVYNSSNQLLTTCGSATPAQLAAGSMSCNLSGLPAGTYYIKAGATDKAGNNQTINSGNFTIGS